MLSLLILARGRRIYRLNSSSTVVRSRARLLVSCLSDRRASIKSNFFILLTGYLNLLYIPVRFLVTRPFMRISFQLPERFANISVGIEQWSQLEMEARQAIEWVDVNESCLEGWFVGLYSFFICALVQVSRGKRSQLQRFADHPPLTSIIRTSGGETLGR